MKCEHPDHQDGMSCEDRAVACNKDCTCCLPVQKVNNEPPPGSWAAVARMMAQDDDSGFDWDAWKDEMKERDM